MPRIPAICGSCGMAYPSNIVVTGRLAAIKDAPAGQPCPHCGGQGMVTTGIYDSVSGALTIVGASGATSDELLALQRVLAESIKAGDSAKSTAEKVGRIGPHFRRLSDYLFEQAKTRRGIALRAALHVAIQLLIHDNIPFADKILEYVNLEDILDRVIDSDHDLRGDS